MQPRSDLFSDEELDEANNVTVIHLSPRKYYFAVCAGLIVLVCSTIAIVVLTVVVFPTLGRAIVSCGDCSDVHHRAGHYDGSTYYDDGDGGDVLDRQRRVVHALSDGGPSTHGCRSDEGTIYYTMFSDEEGYMYPMPARLINCSMCIVPAVVPPGAL